eukprot:scaffold8007_cov78-Skeletonema_marinoi.AAC.1
MQLKKNDFEKSEQFEMKYVGRVIKYLFHTGMNKKERKRKRNKNGKTTRCTRKQEKDTTSQARDKRAPKYITHP